MKNHGRKVNNARTWKAGVVPFDPPLMIRFHSKPCGLAQTRGISVRKLVGHRNLPRLASDPIYRSSAPHLLAHCGCTGSMVQPRSRTNARSASLACRLSQSANKGSIVLCHHDGTSEIIDVV